MSELNKRLSKLSPEQRELLLKKLKQKGQKPKSDRISKRSNQDVYPISSSQMRLWFLQQLEPESSFYNIPSAVRLTGILDINILEQSINEVIRRHEILRAYFDTDYQGNPFQKIVPELKIKLKVTHEGDLSAEEIALRLKDEASKAFNINVSPLLRVVLFRLNNRNHILYLNMHHLIADGWSIGVFINEIVMIYKGLKATPVQHLPEPTLQFADFADWQKRHVGDKELDSQLEYWKNYLTGMAETLDLYTDFKRPEIQSHSGKQFIFTLDNEILNGCKQLAQELNVSLYALLMATFQMFLSKISGQNDFGIGAPIANRNRAEIESLIGFFVNTIVLRAQFSEDIPFAALIKKVGQDIITASDNQDIPFEKIVEAVSVKPSLSRSPLFQVMFDLQKVPFDELHLDQLEIEIVDIEIEVAKFDLLLLLLENKNGIQCTFEYNTDLFTASTIERFSSYFITLVQNILRNPQARFSDLSLMNSAEEERVLFKWNKTQTDYPRHKSVDLVFRDQVEETPNAIAIRYGNQEITYKDLDIKTNQLAHLIIEKGVQKDDLVALYMDRSFEMMLSILAILKVGAIYVPMDVTYPKDRLTFILDDTKANLLITQPSLQNDFEDHQVQKLVLDPETDISNYPQDSTDRQNNPLDPAYVMYTSGSTGTPKGAVIPHRAIVRLVKNTNYIDVTTKHRFAQVSNAAFDAFTVEIWGALLNGAQLVGISKEIMLSTPDLISTLENEKISHIVFTTSVFNQIILNDPSAFRTLKTVMFGGETADPEMVNRVLSAECPRNLINVYGPTENTTFSSVYSMKKGDKIEQNVPIGPPIANSTCYVLDKYMKPVPVGIPGELYVGGDGLALEYFNRPDLTDERFVKNPFNEEDPRLYKTGDLVRYLENGNLDFLDRMDQQVKIRGFRIELGEIESFLKVAPNIYDAAVIMRQDNGTDKTLVAYVVPLDNQTINNVEIREFLKHKLPDYMIPVIYVQLPQIPLTPNGKVDRRALPAPDASRPDLENAYVEPRNDLEKCLTEYWAEILNVDKVGIKDSFFDLGGNSLKAAVFSNRIQKELEVTTHVSMIFKAPTVAELAAYIVNYFPKIAFEQFKLDGSVEEIYKLVDVKTEKNSRIGTQQIKQMRKIITPLASRVQKHEHKNPPASFVLSPPRSGSTLLRVMLAGSSELFSPPELDLLTFNTLQERKEAFSNNGLDIWLEATIRAIKELKNTDVAEATKIMSDFEKQNLSVKEFYQHLQDWMGERILIDKSPTYPFDLNILKRAEEDFNESKYIHLLRHPYAMIYSFIEAKLDKNFFRYPHQFTRRELAELIYVISHQNINTFLKNIPAERQYKLKFEDLVNDPFKEMSHLTSFLNIKFDSEMLKPYKGNKMTDGITTNSQMVGDFKFYLRKNIDTGVADRWREHHDQDFLGDAGWDLAEQFGYAIEREIAQEKDPLSITEIKPIDRKSNLPLSFAQQRLWFLDQMSPGDVQYNIPGAIRLKGDLQFNSLEQTLNHIIERHETLRTVFKSSEDGQASQVILPHLPLKIELVKAMHASNADLLQIANEEARIPFNLSSGPLLRAKVVQVDAQEYVFIVVMHHIIADGWSVNLFIKELAAIYNALVNNKEIPFKKIDIQYVDFAAWQRGWLTDNSTQQQLEYWKKQLAGLSPSLELPTDFKRPAVMDHDGRRIVFRFSRGMFHSLKHFSNQNEATLFMTLLAAFQALLYRYSGQEDFTIGTPVANRNRAEIEPLIGFFANTLVLRSTISGDRSFAHLLRQVKKIAMEAYDHQDIPFEKLVDTLQPERNMNQTPLFQVMFSLQRSEAQEIKLSGLTLIPFELESGSAKFDLNLEIVEHAERMVGIIEYKTSLFREETINKMIGHFNILLESIVENPDQNISTIPIMSEQERVQILAKWIPEKLPYFENHCLHKRIEMQAGENPEAFAVGIFNETLSFSELNKKANRLATLLIKKGVRPKSIIGILMERSTDMIVSMLAIWKTGSAYLPLDPTYPVDRLSFMLNDANTPVLLSHSSLESNLYLDNIQTINLDETWPQIEQQDSTNPTVEVSSEDLAYIIYTSGSTGKPKGVMISHKSALHLAANLDKTIYSHFPGEKLHISLNAPIPFDASVQQIVMLTYGHGLQVVPMEVRGDGLSMLNYIRNYKIQILDCVPAQLKLMLEAGLLDEDHFKPLAVLPGGEAIDELTWEKLVESKTTKFYNMYGPTECTVDSTICDVLTSPNYPVIGRAVANSKFYILDQNELLVPEGVAGELHISGSGLARGYLNRPDLTSEKFVSNPFDSGSFSRMYKTGDLVRRLPDGNIEFLGRVDHQVKVRGFRMELGEIEAQLRTHSTVIDAVVIVTELKKDDKRVVAYLLLNEDQKLDISLLRAFLKSNLPDYMVPAIFMPLDQFPLLPNGKINRKALPTPEFDRADLGIELVEASSEREKVFSEIWKAVLGVDQIGIRDNFFELGGDSILSIQVVARANQSGLKVTPKQIFENPTIESLAQTAEQIKVIEAEQGTVSGSFKLTPIQKEFFSNEYAQPWHWNQSLVLETGSDIDDEILKKVLNKIVDHHDGLRQRFPASSQNGQASIVEEEKAELLQKFDYSDLDEDEQDQAIRKAISDLQASLNLETGPILRSAIVKRGTAKGDLIVLVIHHLAIDGVSWRILSEDMQTAYSQLMSGLEINLPPKTTSFKQWSNKIDSFIHNGGFAEEQIFWQTLGKNRVEKLDTDLQNGLNIESSIKTLCLNFDEAFTEHLLRDIHSIFNTQMNDVLLTALVNAFKTWRGHSRILIFLEGHGREEIIPDISLARTIGWFTSKYPVLLNLSHTSDMGESLTSIKEQIRQIPNNGIGYSLLKYSSPDGLDEMQEPEIIFNYLGQFQSEENTQTLFKPISGLNIDERSPAANRKQLIDLSASVKNGRFYVDLSYSQNLFKDETMQSLLDQYTIELEKLVIFLQEDNSGNYTPSDFQDVDLESEDLDDILSELED